VSWFVRGQLRIEHGIVRHTEGAAQSLVC